MFYGEHECVFYLSNSQMEHNLSDKERASHIEITVFDIVEQLGYHIKFLQEVDDIPELKTKRYRELAAFRYEKYWLPLISTYSKPNLVGPLDVEWMWHCHMLAPLNYIQDCTIREGKVINHRLRNDRDRKICQERAKYIWSLMYEEEPFDLDYTQEMVEDSLRIKHFKSCFSYDIVAASERQSSFYYNVALPHYNDRSFLENALSRYKQYIYTIKQYPDAALRPCYDIDLVWHTHMLNPIKYRKDTTAICGGLLHHDDTSTDMSVGSKHLITGEMATEQWASLFKERFKIAGTMRRGKSSKTHLSDLNMTDVREKVIIQKGTLYVSSITVSGPTLKKKKLDNMYIVFKTNDRIVLQLEGSHAALSTSNNGVVQATWPVKDLYFEVMENETRWLSFELMLRKRKLLGISRDSESIFTGIKDLNSNQFRDGSSNEHQFEKAIANYTLQVNATFTPHTKRIDFFLNAGNFSEVKTPEEIKSLICDKTEEHELIPYMKETCITARHMLGNIRGHSDISVNVFHCARLMTSRIQVLSGSHVVAIAELISTDQLPSPDQVDGDIPTIDPSLGERAVVIKNNMGDWAVLIGSWMGYRGGKEGKTFQRCIINNKGENIAQEYELPKRLETRGGLQYRIYLLPSCQKSTSLPEHLKVNFYTGDIQMFDRFEEAAENICLVFSVALLHVLCYPRKRDWKEGDQDDLSTDNKVMLAAGLNVLTPSNHYISTHLDENVCLACGFRDQQRNEHSIDGGMKVTGVGVGYDGCVDNIEPSVCIGVDVKACDINWRTVGRKDEDGGVTPIRKCGRFAFTCSCSICQPPPPPRTNWNCHEESCRCPVCSCGGRCMHTVATR